MHIKTPRFQLAHRGSTTDVRIEIEVGVWKRTLISFTVRACLVTLKLYEVLQGRTILLGSISGWIGPPRHGGVMSRARYSEMSAMVRTVFGGRCVRSVYQCACVGCGGCGEGSLQGYFIRAEASNVNGEGTSDVGGLALLESVVMYVSQNTKLICCQYSMTVLYFIVLKCGGTFQICNRHFLVNGIEIGSPQTARSAS
jgi:hypothetical protein